MSTTDTPRTDAAIYEEDTGYNGMVKVVSPDFARGLERELNEAKARAIEFESAYVKRSTALDAARDRYEKAESELAAVARLEGEVAKLNRELEELKASIKAGHWDY